MFLEYRGKSNTFTILMEAGVLPEEGLLEHARMAELVDALDSKSNVP